jgi:glucose-1-phosphate cytidylyltransferase
MNQYAHDGFDRFVLCLGYKGEMIRDYFLNYYAHHNDFTLRLNGSQPTLQTHVEDTLNWEVTCADTGQNAQTGARIRRIQKYISGSYFLATYGDGVCNVDINELIAFHREHGRVATVTGVHPPARFGELVVGDQSRVSQFAEKPKLGPRAGSGYVNGGYFVFNREIFDYLEDDDACILERTPLERLAAEGELQIYRHDGFWQCMDTPKDREMLDDLLSSPSSPLAIHTNTGGLRAAVGD